MGHALRLHVSDATEQKQVLIDDIHPDSTIREMIEEAVPLLRLARRDGEGRPLSYQAQLARERRHLHGSERVGDSVSADDRVILAPSIEAGERTVSFRFGLEILTTAGRTLSQAPLAADFEPAVEWTRLLAVRRGALPGSVTRARASVRPVWHETLGQPYTSAFRVALAFDGSAEFAHEFPPSYFRDEARGMSSDLVESGRLADGERFRFVVTAFPGAEVEEGAGDHRPRCVDVSPPLPLREGSLDEWHRRSAPHGEVRSEDLPVFVRQAVLDEVASAARAAGELETGGLLVGHLMVDRDAPEVFAMIEAQIPADDTSASATRLEFTPRTWSRARDLLALRRRDEVFLGWHHSHPSHRGWQCASCPLERRRRCPLAVGHFSSHDRAVHRAIFPRAWGVALVANVIAEDEVVFSCFGWRDGGIESRGFHVVDGAARVVEDSTRKEVADEV